MTWHADTGLLERYARGEADQTMSFSIEAHLMKCEVCRATVGELVAPARLERMWHGALECIEEPRRGPIERVLVRVGVPDHVARLLAATPSLRVSWLSALAVALGFGVAAANQGTPGLLLFLIIAPLAPLIGVAVAYGPGVDPTYEIGLAAPMKGSRLLLVRAAAVLATAILMAGASALFLPAVGWKAAAWLLPSLALTSSSLALSTLTAPARAALVLAVAWIALSGGSAFVSADDLIVFRAAGQVAFAAAAVGSAVVFAARRDGLEIRRSP